MLYSMAVAFTHLFSFSCLCSSDFYMMQREYQAKAKLLPRRGEYFEVQMFTTYEITAHR